MKKLLPVIFIAFLFSFISPKLIFAECDNVAYLDSLGGSAKSQPIIQQFSGRMIIAVRGGNDEIWVREWNNSSLTGWYIVNGGTTSGNLRMVVENGSLIIYAQGSDGNIYKSQYESQQKWSAWQKTGQVNSAFGPYGSNVSGGYKAYTIGPNNVVKIGKCVNGNQPEWIKNLIIYEIATKAFTSPAGPETGNFKSLKEKLSYLADLGITGIWLTGHSLSDPHHFFNIWTQYACIRPDVIDPSLGTDQDFRDLINEAHGKNIKIFLDVITHGVMDSSSLVSQRPSWFNGSSWRMADYDWNNVGGDQAELEKWWIDMWTNYAVGYGVDGFRLDLGHSRHDLWAAIRDRSSRAGRAIAIISEAPDAEGINKGVYDLWQQDRAFSTSANLINMQPFSSYRLTIIYRDNTQKDIAITANEPSSKLDGEIYAFYRGRNQDMVGREKIERDGILDNHVSVIGIDQSKSIANIIISTLVGKWQAIGAGNWYVIYQRNGSQAEVYFSPYDGEPSFETSEKKYRIQAISCHDHADYALKGSLAKTAYTMFLPAVPLFMAGEEFNNPYTPLSNKSRCLYGAEATFDSQWCAGWLYSSQLQWQELQNPANSSFFGSFKKIISLRKNQKSLNSFAPTLSAANFLAISNYNSDVPVYQPYARWEEGEIAVVAANENPRQATIEINFNKVLGLARMAGHDHYKVTDLLNNEERTVSKAELASFSFVVDPDNFKLYSIVAAQTACLPNQVSGCKICAADGFGWIDDNFKCAAGQYCEAGVCKSNTTCDPKTCARLGNYQCGDWSDGCGATISCGSCVAGKTCNASGQCVSQTTGGPVVTGPGPQTPTQIQPHKMTRAEILTKIAEIKKLLIQLIIQLIAELQKQLSAMSKTN